MRLVDEEGHRHRLGYAGYGSANTHVRLAVQSGVRSTDIL